MSPTLLPEEGSPPRGTLPHLLRTIHVSVSLPEASDDEPDDDQLLALIEGRLSSDQLARLEDQLRECPYSADRVAIVRAALHEAGVSLPRRWLVWSTED